MNKNWIIVLAVAIALFWANVAFGQFDGLQINLEKKSMVIGKNKRISLFCSFDGQHYYVGNKAAPKMDSSNPDSWFKRDADTLMEISKQEFNVVSEMVLGLSSINILDGLDVNSFKIVHDPTILELELSINGQTVSYRLFLPLYQNTHFKQFEEVCEAIILLAKEDPDEFLERTTKKKKWYER